MVLRRRSVAVLAVTSMTVVATAMGSWVTEARAGTGQQPVREITVTELRGPDGEPLQRATALNDRGQVVTLTNIDGSNMGEVVLWQRGAATRISPEGVHAAPLDISERGHVVGGTEDEDFRSVQFSWYQGEWANLPAGDDTDGFAVTVNNRGQVLGREMTYYPSRDFVMTVWRGDRVTETPVYSDVRWATPVGINDRGEAVFDVTHTERTRSAYHWQVGGEVTDLGNLGSPWTRANDINGRGQIVGTTGTGVSGEQHAFLWEDGEMTDLGTLGGPRSEAFAVNDRGQVVGHSTTETGEQHAFLWEDGEMTDLGTLGGSSSEAVDINNRGQVVGRSYTGTGGYGEQHAFLWEGGEMTDLSALAGSSLNRSSDELDINERGQVVGTLAIDIVGRAVLWNVH